MIWRGHWREGALTRDHVALQTLLIPDLYHREEVCFDCESDSSLTFPDGSHPFQRLHFSLPVLWECEVAAKIAMPC